MTDWVPCLCCLHAVYAVIARQYSAMADVANILLHADTQSSSLYVHKQRSEYTQNIAATFRTHSRTSDPAADVQVWTRPGLTLWLIGQVWENFLSHVVDSSWQCAVLVCRAEKQQKVPVYVWIGLSHKDIGGRCAKEAVPLKYRYKETRAKVLYNS